MSLRTWLFNVTPAGTALTTSNLKSVDNVAANLVSLGTGSIVSSTANGATSSALFTAPSGSTTVARFPHVGTTDLSGAFTFYLYPGTTPAGTEPIADARHASGYAFRLKLDNARRLIVSDSADANPITATNAIGVATQHYRFGVVYTVATSTTGSLTVNVYVGDSTTPITGAGITTTVANLGTAAVQLIQLGRSGSGGAVAWQYKTLQQNNGSTTEIGPYSPPASTPPTINPGSAQDVDPGTVGLSGTVTISGDTISSASWSLVSGPTNPSITTSTTGVGTASVTATASVPVAAGRYVFRLTGTGAAGGQASGDVTIYVAAAANADVLPYQELSGSYTSVGGAPDRITAITDNNATTYLESSAAPSADAEILQWAPFSDGDIKFMFSGYQAPASPVINVTVTVFKADGTTQIYQDSFLASSGNTEATITLSPTALAAIPNRSDRRALVTRVSATQ